MQKILNLPNIVQKLFCDMLLELVIDRASCIGVATNSQLMRGSLDQSRFKKDNRKAVHVQVFRICSLLGNFEFTIFSPKTQRRASVVCVT